MAAALFDTNVFRIIMRRNHLGAGFASVATPVSRASVGASATGLQLALGFSLQSVLSWAAPEAGAAFARARKLCEQMGDDPRFFAALAE
jgi:hypothetical protein